ncbi:MAG TPA: carboxypeptidase-like regulatory domain-containing protein [Bacteroidales bacterium]|nr:carboxypeptidase-like regulatory domain-containing protein [Bacteroidales bacterium]
MLKSLRTDQISSKLYNLDLWKKQMTLLLLILIAFVNGYGQSKQSGSLTITGTVFQKESNKPLENAKILFFDTSSNQMSGTVTDKNGNYIVVIPRQVRTLTFAYEGLKSKKVELKGNNKIDVYLERKGNDAKPIKPPKN